MVKLECPVCKEGIVLISLEDITALMVANRDLAEIAFTDAERRQKELEELNKLIEAQDIRIKELREMVDAYLEQRLRKLGEDTSE